MTNTAEEPTADPPPAAVQPEFVVTKQHRRFAEFCDAVRRDRYIGLCHGAPGVGKTLSARHYSGWDTVEPVVKHFRFEKTLAPEAAIAARTVLYTPTVHNTPLIVEKNVRSLHARLSWAIDATIHPDRPHEQADLSDVTHTELIIVDEADRLKTAGLEALRDHHDRTGAGVVLIGMPGIERRLARFPQLYSRVGFLHHYQRLSDDEQAFLLSHRWPELGLNADDYATAEARAAIIRVTSGNFRLTTRLIAQIRRVMEINKLNAVTSEVVDAARESLVIGTS